MKTLVEIGPYGDPLVNKRDPNEDERWILIEGDPQSTAIASTGAFLEHRDRVAVLGGGFETAGDSIPPGSVDEISMRNFLGGDGIYPPGNPYHVDYEKLLQFCQNVLGGGGSVKAIEERDYTPADLDLVRKLFEIGGFKLDDLTRDGEGYTAIFNRR